MKKIDGIRKEEFLALYTQGFNDYDIARSMGVSHSTIFRWRRESGLPPHRVRIISQSKEVLPSQEQLEILTGILLGDSSLQYYSNHRWKTPKFKCDHCLKQKDYAIYLAEKLSSLGSRIKEYHRTDKRNNRRYTVYCVTTKSNPFFKHMYNLLYPKGKKEINPTFLNNFTIKSLAFLYMDDGYADQKTAYICTDNFSKESKEILVKYLLKRFNLRFSIVNHGKYYRLRLSQYDFSRFCALVRPYIIDSLQYKLKTVS